MDGVLDGWLLAEEDAALVPGVVAAGIRAEAAPLWMSSPEASAEIVRAALRLAEGLRDAP